MRLISPWSSYLYWHSIWDLLPNAMPFLAKAQLQNFFWAERQGFKQVRSWALAILNRLSFFWVKAQLQTSVYLSGFFKILD